jgi:hypothetical protein
LATDFCGCGFWIVGMLLENSTLPHVLVRMLFYLSYKIAIFVNFKKKSTQRFKNYSPRMGVVFKNANIQ